METIKPKLTQSGLPHIIIIHYLILIYSQKPARYNTQISNKYPNQPPLQISCIPIKFFNMSEIMRDSKNRPHQSNNSGSL